MGSHSMQFISRIATLEFRRIPLVSRRFAKRFAWTSNSPQVICFRNAPLRSVSMREYSLQVTLGIPFASGLISTSAVSFLKYVAFLLSSSVIGMTFISSVPPFFLQAFFPVLLSSL